MVSGIACINGIYLEDPIWCSRVIGSVFLFTVASGTDTPAADTRPLREPMTNSGEQSLTRTLPGMPRTRRVCWHQGGAFSNCGNAAYVGRKPKLSGSWMRSGIVIKNPSLGLTSLWVKHQKFAGQLSQTDKKPRRRFLIFSDLAFSQTPKNLRRPSLPPSKRLLQDDYQQTAHKKT